MSTELELPEIRAWARAELPGYTDSDLNRIINDWSSTPRTRRELHWLEQALARQRRDTRTSHRYPA